MVAKQFCVHFTIMQDVCPQSSEKLSALTGRLCCVLHWPGLAHSDPRDTPVSLVSDALRGIGYGSPGYKHFPRQALAPTASVKQLMLLELGSFLVRKNEDKRLSRNTCAIILDSGPWRVQSR